MAAMKDETSLSTGSLAPRPRDFSRSGVIIIFPLATPLTPGVMTRVQLLHTLPRDMGVNLSRRQVTVTQQHLHYAQISAVIE